MIIEFIIGGFFATIISATIGSLWLADSLDKREVQDLNDDEYKERKHQVDLEYAMHPPPPPAPDPMLDKVSALKEQLEYWRDMASHACFSEDRAAVRNRIINLEKQLFDCLKR